MKRHDPPGQLLFDWAAPSPPTASSPTPAQPLPSSPQSLEGSAISPPPPPSDPPAPVQALPWDFVTTFPMPTDQAVETGVLHDDDRDPEHVRLIHQEHAAEALGVLADLDTLRDARRRGVDPRSGRPPPDEATRERLARFFETELRRLDGHFENLLGAYADGFGLAAAEAYEKALRARHAGVPVVAAIPSASAALAPSPTDPDPAPSAGNAVASPPLPRRRKRASTALTVPRPLAAAVAAGNFGWEEDGTPVDPSPAEVRAIGQAQTEKLVELLGQGAPPHDALAAVLQAYAQDFGEKAAAQLDAHARKVFRQSQGMR